MFWAEYRNSGFLALQMYWMLTCHAGSAQLCWDRMDSQLLSVQLARLCRFVPLLNRSPCHHLQQASAKLIRRAREIQLLLQQAYQVLDLLRPQESLLRYQGLVYKPIPNRVGRKVLAAICPVQAARLHQWTKHQGQALAHCLPAMPHPNCQLLRRRGNFTLMPTQAPSPFQGMRTAQLHLDRALSCLVVLEAVAG